MSQLRDTTYLFGSNSIYVAEIYERYLANPNSVDPSWKTLFDQLKDNPQNVKKDFSPWAKSKTGVVGYQDPDSVPARKIANDSKSQTVQESDSLASIRADMLIRHYRMAGHFRANLDPLDLELLEHHPELDPEFYGFKSEDYERPIYLGGLLGLERATLNQILAILETTYCGSIGAEFRHVQSQEQQVWIMDKMEKHRGVPPISAEEKKSIYDRLVAAEGFEQFLHIKYPGTKRFSLEGGDSLIPCLEAMIETSSQLGVEEIVIGMPHRGRLNVLTAIMGKPYSSMISEFQGNLAHPQHVKISGDVKYHLGTSSDRTFGDKKVHLSLTANPSHLEAVNPVVAGKVRAKQDQRNDENRTRVMGLLLHGDASFAGQGVVAETLSLGELKGYRTGGTIHVIVNNQIGFTTSPKNARASRYPSDFAKIIQAPIFHVNGDDPEAVVFVAKMAAEYRQLFGREVIIDIFCYRRHGHNEGDEPSFTQPQMYKKIDELRTAPELYAERLIHDGVATELELEQRKAKFKEFLEKEYQAAQGFKPNKADWLEGKWVGFEKAEAAKTDNVPTGVDEKMLKKIGEVLTKVPQGFNLHPKLSRQLETKKQMFETGKGIDWATAEALAFGSLLLEGNSVRITGQDTCRGTFSHRHAVLIDQVTEEKHIPLTNLDKNQARFEIIDSNLSEFAVMGFEYGYSLAEPKSLVLWEAQFGDFVNGAQVIIDQFISSGEEKWLRMSGLVLLLPHGYEGQGPEHSSARLERFLQLCAEDNIQVANCSTPASYFHILRRQLVRKFRKPLIIMTPKSLLRHKLAQSTLKEIGTGTSLQHIIPEQDKIATDGKIKRVILCSGKVYYDLYEAREKQKINDIAIIRIEQLYPFPRTLVINELKRYRSAEIIWCQEEPQNMGAWKYIESCLEEAILEAKIEAKRPRYIGRPKSASTAAGYTKIHNEEQTKIINEALSIG